MNFYDDHNISENDKIWCERFEIKLLNHFKENMELLNDKKTIINFIKEKNIINKDYTIRTVRMYVLLINTILLKYEIPYYLHVFDFGNDFKNFKNEGYLYDEFIESIEGFINFQDMRVAILSFEGLQVSEIVNIKIKDINYNDNYIKIENRKFPIRNQMVKDILKKTELEDSYDSVGTKQVSYGLNMSSPYLIKPVPRKTNDYGYAPSKESNIKFKFKKFKALSEDKKISLKTYNLSGAAYYLNEYLKKTRTEPTLTNVQKFMHDHNIKGTSRQNLRNYWKELYLDESK